MRLAASTSILVGSQAVYNGGLAVEVLLLARWFEAPSLGRYFYALALASLFEVGVHWGGQHLVNREAAIRPRDLERWLPALLAASALTTALVVTVVGAAHGLVLAAIAGAALVRAASGLLGSVCIGRGRVLGPALGRCLAPVVSLLGLLVWVRPQPTLGRLAAVVTTTTVAYLAPLLWAHHRLGTPWLAAPRTWPAAWCRLGRRLWPFVALYFFGQLLYRSDAALLRWLADAATVGRYMLAFKWVEGLFFLPFAAASAAIPALATTTREGASPLAAEAPGTSLPETGSQRPACPRIGSWAGPATTVARVGWRLVAATTAAAVVLRLAGEPLLHRLLGSVFLASAPLFRSLVWVLPLHALGVLLAATLVARHRERALLAVTATTAAGGVALRMIAFPALGVHAFVAGLYLSLLVYISGCAWSLRPSSRRPG